MTCGVQVDPNTGKLTDVLLDGIHAPDYSVNHGGINEKDRSKWRRLVIRGENTLGFNVAIVIEDVKGVDDPSPIGYTFTYMNTWRDGSIKEATDRDDVIDDNAEDIVTNAKIGDISKYTKQASQLYEKGYALDTRFADFFKNLVRVTSAVNTYRPDSFKNIPQVWDSYEQYLVLLEYYKTYTGNINRTAAGIKNISRALCGI